MLPCTRRPTNAAERTWLVCRSRLNLPQALGRKGGLSK